MIKRIGNYYCLPIEGDRVISIEHNMLYFYFERNKTGVLEVSGRFKLELHGKEIDSFDIVNDMFDFLEDYIITNEINFARSDKFGNLVIKIGSDLKLVMDDGPYENWHYTDNKNMLHIHGGCGALIY